MSELEFLLIGLTVPLLTLVFALWVTSGDSDGKSDLKK